MSSSIHSFFLHLPILQLGREVLLPVIGERQYTSWTGPVLHAHIPEDRLERPNNLTAKVWTQACIGRICKLNAERSQAGIQPRNLLLQINSVTNEPLFHSLQPQIITQIATMIKCLSGHF